MINQTADSAIDDEYPSTLGLRKQQSSVRHLQALFAIVAGLALTEAVSMLAREVNNGLPTGRTLMLMIAFLATVIPFFHGGLRHLDDVYIVTPPDHGMSRYALLVDFILLFLESVLMLGMAHRLADPPHFLAFLIFLLAVDIVWAIVTPPLIETSKGFLQVVKESVPRFPMSKHAATAWAQNNIIFVPIAAVAWFLIDWQDWSSTVDAMIVMTLALARSANDYRLSWNFYFPPPEPAPAPA